MDEEWDADTFEPPEIKTAPSVGANKWEGEDEDEDVKDNWEDEEEEEKKDVEKQESAKPMQVKKNKKTLAEKIEEKEQRQREEAERKAKAREVKEELTVEEIQAEKLRQQKLQEESDLRVAMETFGIGGIGETSTVSGIDAMNPDTKEEFDELQQAISKKVQLYTKSAHFPVFAEDLIRNICANLGSQDLKKLKTTVENMFLEKTKAEKGDKAKKNKGKGKVKLKVEGDHALVNEYSAYGDLDDYDDFM